LLLEETYELQDKGTVQVRSAKLRTLPNIRFAFEALSRALGCGFTLDTSSVGWQATPRALQVRHNLMHPKSSLSLTVSDEEMDTVYQVGEWFTENVKALFAVASPELGESDVV